MATRTTEKTYVCPSPSTFKPWMCRPLLPTPMSYDAIVGFTIFLSSDRSIYTNLAFVFQYWRYVNRLSPPCSPFSVQRFASTCTFISREVSRTEQRGSRKWASQREYCTVALCVSTVASEVANGRVLGIEQGCLARSYWRASACRLHLRANVFLRNT